MNGLMTGFEREKKVWFLSWILKTLLLLLIEIFWMLSYRPKGSDPLHVSLVQTSLLLLMASPRERFLLLKASYREILFLLFFFFYLGCGLFELSARS